MSGYARIVGLALLTSSVIGLSSRTAVAGTPAAGNLFFDTFRVTAVFGTGHDATVQEVRFNYDGASSFTLGTPATIADLGSSNNADGLIFAPNGNLLIGGSTSGQIEQITQSGSVVGFVNVANTNPYHLTLSLDGKTIYSGGATVNLTGDNPGPLGVTPFFSNGAGHALSGDDTGLTQIAFDPSGNAYYTSSPDTGTGSVGAINLSTYTTTRHISGLIAAHGITYDPYTGNLMVAGGNHITQIDPKTFAVVSDLDLSARGISLSMLDQVYVDGHGHLFAGDNGNVSFLTGTGTKGKLVFVDYTGSGKIGDAGDFVAAPSLALALDDIAPVSALLPGDANFDGNVGFDDLVTLARHYGQNGGWLDGDFDGDGKIGFSDLVVLARHYGQSLTSGGAAGAAVQTPEPTTLALLLLPAGMLLRRRR